MASKSLKKINIFLASPSDVVEEREIVSETINGLNADIFEPDGYTMRVMRWENDTYPLIDGRDGQEVINEQLSLKKFYDYSLFVGIMWSRFGTETPRAGSGTEEEFNLALRAKKGIKGPDIMFYFSKMPMCFSDQEGLDQYSRILSFKKGLKDKGMYWDYEGPEKFGETFRTHLIRWFRSRILSGEKIKETKETPSEKDDGAEILTIPDDYTSWVHDETRSMDINNLVTRGEAIQVGLPAVYIPLMTDDFPEKKDRRKGRKKGKGRGVEEDIESKMEERHLQIDVEVLAAKGPFLLLEGAPGSGKTTMMRHLTRDIIEGMADEGFPGFLPVLVFLKDLNLVMEELGPQACGMPFLRKVFDGYFRVRENGLSCDIIEDFCKAGKAVVMLDGLDELHTEHRESLIECISNLSSKYPGVRVLLTTRPHAVGDAMKWFGDRHRVIRDLTIYQVEMFVQRWFEHLEDRSPVAGRERLMKEIKGNEAVKEFTRTPLMLTAVCLLYMDEKRLPEQRTDLYNRVVNNLVEKRFRGKGKGMPGHVHRFLGELAYDMMDSKLKEVPRARAIEMLERIFPNRAQKKEGDHRRYLADLFDDIEPNCGLINRVKGGYSFYHLSYQEFLAARHIVSTQTQYWDAISERIDDPWWRESVLMFIGFLGMDNLAWAMDIVGRLLENGDTKRVLLAGHGLLDIEEGLRREEVVADVRKRLSEVMFGGEEPKVRLEAGEVLGWLGDDRNLKAFVKIPAGRYPFQKDKTKIASFEMGKYPVTNSWFQEFVNGGGYEDREFWTPKGWRWLCEGYLFTIDSKYREFVTEGLIDKTLRDHINRQLWYIGDEAKLVPRDDIGFELHDRDNRYLMRDNGKEYELFLVEKVTGPVLLDDRKWGCPNFPVVGVSWYEAKAFCKWLTRTLDNGYVYALPKEKQWEAAAGGKEGRKYPWGKGSGKGEDKCNIVRTRLNRTSPVGIFSKGDTPGDPKDGGGITDMAGNVWEWCEDLLLKEGSFRVLRGGSWLSPAVGCRSASRSGGPPGLRWNDVGFRLVRSSD